MIFLEGGLRLKIIINIKFTCRPVRHWRCTFSIAFHHPKSKNHENDINPINQRNLNAKAYNTHTHVCANGLAVAEHVQSYPLEQKIAGFAASDVSLQLNSYAPSISTTMIFNFLQLKMLQPLVSFSLLPI